jgi:hypothetical protein
MHSLPGQSAVERPALRPARIQPSLLTGRRFVDLGRTASMICPQHAY